MSQLQRVCYHGRSCKYFARDSCGFFHPEDHYRHCRMCEKRLSNKSSSYYCGPCYEIFLDLVTTNTCPACKNMYTQINRNHTHICDDCDALKTLLFDFFTKSVNVSCEDAMMTIGAYNDIVFKITYMYEEGGDDEEEYFDTVYEETIMPIVSIFCDHDLAMIQSQKMYENFSLSLLLIIGNLYLFQRSRPVEQIKKIEVISKMSVYIKDYPIESAYQRRHYAVILAILLDSL